MRSLLSLLIVALCMASTVPTSSATALPEPGTRIRLTARMPERERRMGPFVSVAHDTVTMRDAAMNDAVLTVPTLHVMRFEISRGNHPNGLRGAYVGFAIGALLGAGVGYFGTPDKSDIYGQGYIAAAAAVIGGVVGAAVGAGTGALTHSERWQALPLENLHGTATP